MLVVGDLRERRASLEFILAVINAPLDSVRSRSLSVRADADLGSEQFGRTDGDDFGARWAGRPSARPCRLAM